MSEFTPEPISDEILDNLVNAVPFEESRVYQELHEEIEQKANLMIARERAYMVRQLTRQGNTPENIAGIMGWSVAMVQNLIEHSDA